MKVFFDRSRYRRSRSRGGGGAVTTLMTAGIVFGGWACSPAPTATPGAQSAALSDDGVHWAPSAHATVIATGIPGAGAVCEVGLFLPGSPFGAGGPFIANNAAGGNLATTRVLVASSSNFGLPLARPDQYPGTVISIDPAGGAVAVPQDFASGGGQASTLGGRVQVYTGNSPPFLNSVYHPTLVTANLTASALTTALSLNNGNGRPWTANAPNGANGEGTIGVIDPNGAPLGGAPSPVAGGVFAGNETNRTTAPTHGLVTGLLGLAVISKSSDLSGKAVFASVEADGSVAQIHVAKGVDGLAPPGTVTPVASIDPAAMESTDPHTIAREGMAFNWVPTQNMFISDPQANRLVVLDIGQDGTVFTNTAVHTITSRDFNIPIDVAPTAREIAQPNFASNTTLGGGSDLYVLNRGDNTIVRMTIAGKVLAKRSIAVDLPEFRANGLGVSSDGQTIYVTGTLPNHDGALLSVPAFGAGDITPQFMSQAFSAGATDMTGVGTVLFSLQATVDQGLGPLFNASSCAGCHDSPIVGGMGTKADQHEFVVGRMLRNGTVSDLDGLGGPTARAHSIEELGYECDYPTGIPPLANMSSLRNAMTLRGDGLMEAIQQGDVVNHMNAEPAAVRGHLNLFPDGRMGKFGWKANVATLPEFMGDAYRNELGITNAMVPKDEIHACGADKDSPEIDGLPLQAQMAFINTLDPVPQAADPGATCRATPGFAVFHAAGCDGCHAPTLPGRAIQIPLYSDLLLHDMGPGLADGLVQGQASGSEFRTMTLWKISERTKFLHDARATSIPAAIAAHGGQAAASAAAFQNLSAADQQALLDFLGCI